MTAAFFAVTSDPADEAQRRLSEQLPGYRVFWDFDGTIGSLYGALPLDLKAVKANVPARRLWVVLDPTHKRRRDFDIEDPDLIKELQGRFIRRVVPQTQKAHQYKVTRMERYIVSCYAAEDEAHFRAHRDNTTKGAAHRRFAFLPFLYDDEAARMREANNAYLGDGVGAYQSIDKTSEAAR